MDKNLPQSRKGCSYRRTTSTAPRGVISRFSKLLKYTYRLSISARHSKKGVSTLTMWNSTVPIGVDTLAEPIDDVDPIPNCTLTIPCVAMLSCTAESCLWSVRNWP